MEHPLSFRVRVVEVLRSSAIFGALRDEILQALADVMEPRQVHGGELVLHEGEPSDSIVFVISGGLRVSRHDRDGQLLLYNQIQPGQSIGELGMILCRPRAQDVSALRDSRLALLSRKAYEQLLLRFPLELSQAFLQAVYERMRHNSEAAAESPHQRLAQTFALLPLHKEAAANELAQDLSLSFAHLGRTALLSQSPHGLQLLNGEPCQQLDMTRLEEEHEFILFETSHADGDWTRFALRQADQVIFLAKAGAPPTPTPLEASLCLEAGFSLKRQHLVLMHADSASQASAPGPWLRGRALERIYPLRQGRRADAHRLARFLTGGAVGVVLGGGGARGFAHLGILRALHEAHIPVDLIGGNSMGALIGAQLACDRSLEQILRDTQRFAAGGERPTLPLVSLLGGRRVERDLRRMFAERTIDSLWRPFFAAACNLRLGRTTVLDQGLLWRAVLASNSPAGLFPPVLQDGHLLVDGAILENVPVQAMRMRLGTPLERRRGNGSIIAIDVDVRDKLCADPTLERLTLKSTLRRMLSAGAPASPGIADILYTAGHVGGQSQRSRTIAQADHYLEPPVGDFSLMAYAKGADIAEVGYRYAMERIGQWEQRKEWP